MYFVDVNEFEAIIKKEKKVVCFGAGQHSRRLYRVFRDTEILERISYFIDNNQLLWGKEICIGTRRYKIFSPDKLKEDNTGNEVILITTFRYEEILNQIENDFILKNIECYWFGYMNALFLENLSMKKRIPQNIKISSEQLMPKKIHYCWFGGKPMPEKNKQWMKSWRKFCPDYEIIEWNEHNYDVKKNKYMQQAYENKKWGFVPDYARLDIIYHYGGIYLDTDVELLSNLDDLLFQKGFAGFEGEENVALGLGFGAMKGLPIIKELLDQYDSYKFVNADGSLNMTAAPILQTNYLKTKGLIPNGEYQIIEGLTIFPDKMFCGKSVYTKQIKLLDYTKSIHHYDATWFDEKLRQEAERMERIFSSSTFRN